ncbi:MAG: sigma-54 dependent transcriptional regulator [Planctomycetota bacterium]
MSAGRVLVVEDMRVQAHLLRRLLEREGYAVDVASDVESGVEALLSRDYDLVLADMVMDGERDGLELYRRGQSLFGAQAPTVVILTAYGTVESAREALRAGVYDYLTKPVDHRELSVVVQHALEHERLTRENRELNRAKAAREARSRLVGSSPSFLRTLRFVEEAAPTGSSVLLLGESGTGKERVAELVHAMSPRAAGPLIPVNCAAIPEPLLEAELFGHEAGAFTDARRARRGKFEQGQGGTVFLDEVGEMSPKLQVKLLRVLQERQVERLGAGGKSVPVDFRLIAATNRDLAAEVRAGRFREDLYYRINVISIELPPLRQRAGDVELLAEWFRERFNEKNEKAFRGFRSDALRMLSRYGWPGNVRELENVIERAVVLGAGEWISPEHLPLVVRMAPEPEAPLTDLLRYALDDGLSLEDVAQLVIDQALADAGGNVSQAARTLGVTRRTLDYRLRRQSAEANP